MSDKYRWSAYLLIPALAVILAVPVNAAVLEDVVVTAQKREQNVQDVGIAISAFTGDQIRALNVQQSIDIATFVPNVHISGNLAGQNTQFSIRGVTQNDFNDIIEAPNAVYLDEGYIPIANAQTFTVFDIERVEILKGPQGTLFGRNATGGLIQYISRKPNMDNWEGFVDATYGLYDVTGDPDSVRVEAAVGGPMTDRVGARVAMLYNKQDPYLVNLYRSESDSVAQRFGAGTILGGDNSFGPNAPGSDAGADLGDDETLGLRGILQFDATDTLRFTISGNYSDTEVATGPYQSKPTSAVYDGSNPQVGVQLSQGELINVIDTASNDSRLSICADGSDCGADQDNDGVPDDIRNPGTLDQGRFNNLNQLSPGTDFFGYLDPDGDDFTTSGDFAFADSGKTEAYGGQLRIEWDYGQESQFISISDYKNFEKLLFIDVDSAPVNQAANYAGADASSFSQEFRFQGSTEGSRWLAGFYYLNIDTESKNGLKFPTNSTVSLGSPFGFLSPFETGSDARLKTDSYSVFGQVEWDIVDRVTLIGGLRLIREQKNYEFSQSLYATQDSRQIHQGSFSDGTRILIGPLLTESTPGSGIFDTPTSFEDRDREDDLWAGNIQVDYRPNDDVLLYAGIRRGVKAGSYNAQLSGGLPIPNPPGAPMGSTVGVEAAIPYEEEILYAYEAGFKTTLFDGTTRFNGSFFYYDYEDYQAFLFTGVSGIVINADAETVGAELEIQTSPIDGLDILFSAGWFDAEVQDVPFRVGGPISKDVEPTYAPPVQVAGIVRYEWPLFGGYARVQGDFSYSDSYFYNLRNFDADQFDSYTLVNTSLGWQTEDGVFDIGLLFRNITDERAGIQGFDLATLCGCNEVSYRAPRWWGLQAKWSFGGQ
ncbi:MAG: TonB-dependent receptor [Gammaproteobacteria bacterium]|nr:TonB-dependent receptor [Gammaproteobacteria bacterium]